MTASIFYRQVAICLIMTGFFAILNFAALFSIPNMPWVSFAAVHANMTKVSIVKEDFNPDPDMPNVDFKNIEATWWGIFAISIIFVILSFAIGEEARDAYKWIVKQVTQRKPRLPKRSMLPV